MTRIKSKYTITAWNWKDTLIFLLFLSSLGLCLLGIEIYQATIVEAKYIAAFFILLSIPVIYLFILLIKKRNFYIPFTYLFFCTSLLYVGILFLNQRFADKEYSIRQFPILEKGRMGTKGCKNPFIIIDFNGTQKQLVFNCQEAALINNTTLVEISYSMGLFGFPVIGSNRLINW